MNETSVTAAALMTWGPLGLWIAIGWAVTATTVALGFGRTSQLGKTDDDRAAEDAEQMAWVKARADYAQALVRGDTRGQKAALETLMPRTNAVLARELGREWK